MRSLLFIRAFCLYSLSVAVLASLEFPARADQESTLLQIPTQRSENWQPIHREAALLLSQQSPQTGPDTPSAPTPTPSAPEPSSPTELRKNYLGVGPSIGLSGGDSPLGDTSFVILSRAGLTNRLALNSDIVIGDGVAVNLAAVTEFPLGRVIPFAGGGLIINTRDDWDFRPLLSGGANVPINRNFTGTARLNVGFLEETDIGLMLGVGYNLEGF
jgi:hypothetical protein